MRDNRQHRFSNIIDDDRSFAQKYQDLQLGERSLPKLAYYEFCTTFILPVQGALGLVLRKVLLPPLFSRVGKKVIFGHHIGLRAPGRVSIGAGTVLDDYCQISARGEGDDHIAIGARVLVGQNVRLRTRGGSIEIADDVNIAPDCHIGTASRISIGKHCLFGGGCYIGGLQHGHLDTDTPITEQPLVDRGGVTIGDGAWLGAHVIANDGANIGAGAIVGAGSVITKDIPSWSIAVGVPAQVIRSRKPPATENT
ncbi:MAG: acyltransferase [Pseudomonadota bacterium]|nr:acyltransferase [Pseudomonadota bacterium]